MTTAGGDQRDRSSTAAVSFTQDSELIGQIDIQRYVNSLQSTGSCSLARWAARASTEKQARSGKRHRGSGLSIRCRRICRLAPANRPCPLLRLFVGRRPFSSAATTIDVAPPLRGTRTAEMRLTTRKKKNRRAFSRLLLRQIFLVCWRVKGISRRAGDYRDPGHAHIRLPSDRLARRLPASSANCPGRRSDPRQHRCHRHGGAPCDPNSCPAVSER
jgi:hypothetical protein